MRKSTLTLLTLLFAANMAFAGAKITIVNNNAPGVGFNDPSPRAPIGGNPGTTLGQQRLNAFEFAANTWGSTDRQPSGDQNTCRFYSAYLHANFGCAWVGRHNRNLQ